MTREEAEKLANEEIESCINKNEFIRGWIDKLYHSDRLLNYSISENREVIFEKFVEEFLIRSSPLYKVMNE
jgi:hypothetical protein